MQIVVTGAGSALGQSLLRALAARGALAGPEGVQLPLRRIIAVDRIQPAHLFVDARIDYVRGDYEQSRFLPRMMGVITQSIFHLSALGVGAAADPQSTAFDHYDDDLLNSLDTTRALLDACRHQTSTVRIVFASTLAARAPAASVGVCAALCELVLDEGARRGLVDTRSVRLPCVVGSGASAEALAIEALVNQGTAADQQTGVAVLDLEEAAAQLLAAHDAPAVPPGGVTCVEIAGRVRRIGDLRPAGGTQSMARAPSG